MDFNLYQIQASQNPSEGKNIINSGFTAVKDAFASISSGGTVATSGATNGSSGTFMWDDNYLYVKTEKEGGAWGRIAIDYNF